MRKQHLRYFSSFIFTSIFHHSRFQIEAKKVKPIGGGSNSNREEREIHVENEGVCVKEDDDA
ncbi:unnamed protein product, partial [Vitis vinifera]